jgi:hypothetical protein
MSLKEIPSCRAFRSIVSTDVLSFSAIAKAVAPPAAIANRPRLRLPAIPLLFGFEPDLDEPADGLGPAGIVLLPQT